MTKRAPNRVPSLISAAREAALNAVQVYNNPLTKFRSESFIVNMTIAWTYLLHAFYLRQGIEIRTSEPSSKLGKFRKTQGGGYVYWGLSKCVDVKSCPLGPEIKANIKFMIGLRNEVVHKGSPELDDQLAPRFLANCINFETTIVDLFVQKHSLDPHLRFALQFRDLVHSHHLEADPLPSNIADYITQFEGVLPDSTLASSSYAYRVAMVPKTVNRRDETDRVVEFMSDDSDIARTPNHEHDFIKEVERPKIGANRIVNMMKRAGHASFTVQEHTILCKALDAKNPVHGLGVELGGLWYWYEEWVDIVREHCRANADIFRKPKLSPDDRKAVVFPNQPGR